MVSSNIDFCLNGEKQSLRILNAFPQFCKVIIMLENKFLGAFHKCFVSTQSVVSWVYILPSAGADM